MRLALVQMPNYGSRETNLYKSLRAVETAAKQGADLVLFPEVQLTEFFPQYPGQDVRKYAVTIEGETVKEFCNVCRENKKRKTVYTAKKTRILFVTPCQFQIHICETDRHSVIALMEDTPWNIFTKRHWKVQRTSKHTRPSTRR